MPMPFGIYDFAFCPQKRRASMSVFLVRVAGPGEDDRFNQSSCKIPLTLPAILGRGSLLKVNFIVILRLIFVFYNMRTCMSEVVSDQLPSNVFTKSFIDLTLGHW